MHTATVRRRSAATLTSILAVVVALAVGLIPTPAHAGQGPPSNDPTLVETDAGTLRGYATDDHVIFKGVPFARPPVGELRFRGPQPVEPWEGVRDATEAGSACAQKFPSEDGEPELSGSEDCLYLNVHVPSGVEGPMPVMVFLHGGGFGQGDGGMYDPRPVSGRGDVIVVTTNYRLGALGFLHLPGLGGQWSGNFGIADQQAALRWVRENIAELGGDAGNVTLWGESAGAYSVCAQLASPQARGLFDKAITQSGPCGNDLQTRSEATRNAREAARELGCTDPRTVRDCLRRVSTEALADLDHEEVRLTRHITNLPWMPVAGTPAIPVQPLLAARIGIGSHVPMIAGGTRDEMRIYLIERAATEGWITAEDYPDVVKELYGTDAARVLAAYPHEDYDSPSLALATALTDEGRGAGACQQLRFDDVISHRTEVFAYEFAEPSGAVHDGFPAGALHGVDVPYFFESYWPGAQVDDADADKERLANVLIDHWTTFARTGHPGTGWDAYDDGQALSFSTGHIGTVDLRTTHQCDFWATIR
jgi:para-nitrobenzyl esterase